MTKIADVYEMLVHQHEHLLRIEEMVRQSFLITNRRLGKIMATLDRLTQEVAETSTAVDSALTLIAGLAEQIRQLEPTQEALDGFADELDRKQQEIAAAVATNTPAPSSTEPAAPPTEPEPS